MKRVALFVALVTAFGVPACKQSAPRPGAASTTDTTSDSAGAGSAIPGSPGAGSATAAADPWGTAPAEKDPLPRPLFWSITKGGTTSYALGTIHVGVDPEARLPRVVWDKLEAAPAFAMETDLADPALVKLLECHRCSLRRDLGEAHWKKLEALVGAEGAARLDPLKPMVAATMLSLRGLPNTTQMDTLLLARARNRDKRIVFLEPAAHQAAILEKWMNIKVLKAMLDDPETGLQRTLDMLAAYIAGDDAKMVALSEAERADALKHGFTAAEYEESMQDMLYKRNASWIAPIEQLHAAGGGFVAVGAMHLLGPKNVLQLLEAKGYEITRVTP